MHAYQRQTRGFTLIELLVVIAIIAILAALIIPNILGAGGRAKELATEELVQAIRAPMDEYKSKRSRYPAETPTKSTENIVEELGPQNLGLMEFDDNQIDDPDGAGPGKPVMIDGWGTPFRYIPWFGKPDSVKAAASPPPKNKNLYDLWSAGEDVSFDAIDGGPLDQDNINNWSSELTNTP